MKIRTGNRGRWGVLLLLFLFLLLISGCGKGGGKGDREPLDYEVMEEGQLPPELKTIIEEKKQAEFKLTYVLDGALYLVVGLGKQETGGYSISVRDLYLEGGSICLILLQMRKGAKPGLIWEEMALEDGNGNPTQAFRDIYHISD